MRLFSIQELVAEVGVNAGELLMETIVAMEAGFDAHSLGVIIHPHPTLSETVCYAAEMITGTITDLYMRKTTH